MSVDDPKTESLPTSAEVVSLPTLRREALLPNERSRGLGTVAVVCTMAGVASGLALAYLIHRHELVHRLGRAIDLRLLGDVQHRARDRVALPGPARAVAPAAGAARGRPAL